MTEERQDLLEDSWVYKCNICGNIVEILHLGKGQLICCNQPMELLKEKTEGVGQEKHVPVIKKFILSSSTTLRVNSAEETDKGVKVKVGSIPHPMEEKHYIEWMQIIADNIAYRKFLKPGDSPEAEFNIETNQIKARGYCNIHGLWKSS